MKGLPLASRYQRRCSTLVLCCLAICLYGQVEIQVVDVDGGPVPYAYLSSPVEQIELHADEDGLIVLPASYDSSAIATISSVGFADYHTTLGVLARLLKIILQPSAVVETITVVGRTDTKSDRVSNQVETIGKSALTLTQPQTSVEALEQHAGVYVQRSQMGGGSPVLRGFEANRVLLVADGVRMNNAIYRSGHLQNAITVDANVLEQVEVIYGPGALLYGSDALGGVIHFRSRDPQLLLQPDQARHRVSGLLRTSSANKEQTLHATYEARSKSVASLTTISHSSFGDLRSGRYHRYHQSDAPDYGLRTFTAEVVDGTDVIAPTDNPYLQTGTGYSQLNVMQKVKWQTAKDHYLLLNLQATTSSDIPRYDQLTAISNGLPEWARWDYGPQTRLSLSLQSVSSKPTLLWDRLSTIGAYQYINEERITRRFGSDISETQLEQVGVYSITTDASKELASATTLSYGLEGNFNTVTSTVAHSGGPADYQPLTRYADGSNRLRNLAAYILGEQKLGLRHHIAGGIRYTWQTLQVQYLRDDIIEWPASYYSGVRTAVDALTGSLSYRYTTDQWVVSGTLATAFRSPNIDDTAKIRVRRGEVTIPNVDLKPESSYTGEVSISYKPRQNGQVGLTGFHTTLMDAIIQGAARLPDGSNTLNDRGTTLATVTNINAASAWIRGISLAAEYPITPSWTVEGSATYTRGRQSLEGSSSPISHIPPLYGRVSTTYQHKRWLLRAATLFNAAKPLSQYGDATDNLDLATPIGTPAWYIINVHASYGVTSRIVINVSVENILDRFYRPFASGINGPGRDLSLAIRLAL